MGRAQWGFVPVALWDERLDCPERQGVGYFRTTPQRPPVAPVRHLLPTSAAVPRARRR